MSSQRLYRRTALLVTGLCALVAPSACEAPPEETPSVEITDTGGSISDPPSLSLEPDPDDIFIEQIKTNGKGCPQGDPGTVETLISDDRKSFIILYRDMELNYPPGPYVKNLACQAGIRLHIPNGYQVALATVNTRGYLYLDDDMKARQTSGYFFAGIPLGSYPHTHFKGPYDDVYEFSDNIPFESLVWSPCGASALFGINTSLNLNTYDNPDGQAIFSTNTTDGVFRQILHWKIKEC